MDTEKIKKHLLNFQKTSFDSAIEREVSLGDSKKIQTVIGARRTGKTYLLFNKIKELENKGIKRSQIIYINFENPLLNDISYKEVKEVIKIYWSLFPENIEKELFIFIDEPQVIDQWESAIRDLYDNLKCRIFITGSSSKLLSKEIATSLRGRAISIYLVPLSFKEFIKFKGQKYELNKLTTKDEARIINMFREYLRYGGYPEVTLEKNPIDKLKILKDYFELTIYKDLVDRYKINNTKLIKYLINSLVSSVSKDISLNKTFLNFKSQGQKISKNTLYEYFSMLEDSFFIFTTKKHNYSINKEEQTMPKIYLDDVGFLNLFSIEDYGKRMENIVYLELYRKINKKPLIKINYWKSKDGKEVDFIVSEAKKIVQIIQVCYSLNNNSTKERELKSIIECAKQFKKKNATIITNDFEDIQNIEGIKIRYIPLWKWLLMN